MNATAQGAAGQESILDVDPCADRYRPRVVFYSRSKVSGEIRRYPGVADFVEVPREAPFATAGGEQRGGGKRGRAGLMGLSRQSRKRMLRALIPGMPAVMSAALDDGAAALVTLTYGLDAGGFQITPADALGHLQAARNHFQRRGWCGMWIREYQVRGALHWHQVLRGVADRQVEVLDERALAEWWLGLTGCQGSTMQARLLHGVRLDWIRPESGPAQLAAYIAKHSSKGGQRTAERLTDPSTGEIIPLGRPWGYIGRAEWEAGCVPVQVEHSPEGAKLLAERQLAAAFVRQPPVDVIRSAIERGHRYPTVYVHAPSEDIGRQARFVEAGSESEVKILARWPGGIGPGKRKRRWGEVYSLISEVRRRWPGAISVERGRGDGKAESGNVAGVGGECESGERNAA